MTRCACGAEEVVQHRATSPDDGNPASIATEDDVGAGAALLALLSTSMVLCLWPLSLRSCASAQDAALVVSAQIVAGVGLRLLA